MGLFDNAIAWARDQIHAAAPTHIVYRTQVASLPLVATKGGSQFEAETADNYATEEKMIDFLVDPAKLIDAGTAFKPEAGHEIDELDGEGGTVVAKYRIAATPGVPPWEPSGQSRAMIRIHTRQISHE
ncbi:hypothetical protein AB1L30_01290 [Bremerella sp. JC817]|uniref:hypothetical protein n=1 Tax=Bremerella sp. JC817 TaxID=3231756 RepID=UPI003457F008